ncbi:hypothetical protein GYMLUDRAFT_729627 [Collybiopsis luxurians FD-317 M1]|nr:hypothetical protein GYMLUDRAFT_729627 [Collybiopsis luxurians FD-317 M1]
MALVWDGGDNGKMWIRCAFNSVCSNVSGLFARPSDPLSLLPTRFAVLSCVRLHEASTPCSARLAMPLTGVECKGKRSSAAVRRFWGFVSPRSEAILLERSIFSGLPLCGGSFDCSAVKSEWEESVREGDAVHIPRASSCSKTAFPFPF